MNFDKESKSRIFFEGSGGGGEGRGKRRYAGEVVDIKRMTNDKEPKSRNL